VPVVGTEIVHVAAQALFDSDVIREYLDSTNSPPGWTPWTTHDVIA
jgi:hypothetical protein